jgi:hypothetical protein
MSLPKILKIIIVTVLSFSLLFTLGITKCQKVVEEAMELEEGSEDDIEAIEKILEEGEEVNTEEEKVEKFEEPTEEEPVKVVIYDITYHSNIEDPYLPGPSAYSIYACMLDGSDLSKIYDSGTGDFDPSLNSDHTKIVFSSYMDEDGDSDIFIYDLKTDEVSKVFDRQGHDFSPDFSPDGSSIAFSGQVGGESLENFEIFTVNPDGSDLTQLTDNSHFDGFPDFSPDQDQSQLMFTSKRDGPDNIYTMDTDGTNVMNRTIFGDCNDFDGSFSPEGDYAVLVSNRSGDHDIWAIPLVDDPGLQEEISMVLAENISNHPANDLCPTYGFNEYVVAFLTERDYEANIYNLYTAEHTGDLNFTGPEPIVEYSDPLIEFSPYSINMRLEYMGED